MIIGVAVRCCMLLWRWSCMTVLRLWLVLLVAVLRSLLLEF